MPSLDQADCRSWKLDSRQYLRVLLADRLQVARVQMKGVQDGRRDSAVSTGLVTMFLLSPGFEKSIVTLVSSCANPPCSAFFLTACINQTYVRVITIREFASFTYFSI